MDLQIRRAKPDEAAVLTEIAHAAKRYWGYPENWIEHWKADLTITSEFIANNEMYVAVAAEEIVGCCAITFSESPAGGSLAELEHMWIRPERMGAGVGRALFTQARERAADLKVPVMELSADPNAEGFYERMGARRIGEVPAEMEGKSRTLPRMSVDLESVHKKEPPGWERRSLYFDVVFEVQSINLSLSRWERVGRGLVEPPQDLHPLPRPSTNGRREKTN